MTWLDNFYLSENITDNRKAVKRRINFNSNILEYYLLTVSNRNEDLVDIIPALEFKNMSDFKKNNMVIVGVSNGYHNAKRMVESFSDDLLKQIKEQ